jgi:hypothetical protein
MQTRWQEVLSCVRLQNLSDPAYYFVTGLIPVVTAWLLLLFLWLFEPEEGWSPVGPSEESEIETPALGWCEVHIPLKDKEHLVVEHECWIYQNRVFLVTDPLHLTSEKD